MALQTTSGSLREKWVAAFLPTAAIILVAFLYFNFSLNPEMGEVEKEYKAAKAASVSQADIDMRQSQSEELRNEVDELEKAKKSFETEMEVKKKEFTQRKPTEKKRNDAPGPTEPAPKGTPRDHGKQRKTTGAHCFALFRIL